MNKTRHLHQLTTIALVALLALAGGPGCRMLSKAAIWAENNPQEASLARSLLFSGLALAVNNNPDLASEKSAIEDLIDYSLGNADSPEAAVALIRSKLEKELGQRVSSDTAKELYAIWAEHLKAEDSGEAPAGGPSVDYADAMADAFSGI